MVEQWLKRHLTHFVVCEINVRIDRVRGNLPLFLLLLYPLLVNNRCDLDLLDSRDCDVGILFKRSALQEWCEMYMKVTVSIVVLCAG